MKKLLAAILFMFVSSANAGVTYSWETVKRGAAPKEIKMSIVFTEAAVRSGSVNNHDCNSELFPVDCDKIVNPVENFYFSGGTMQDIDVRPGHYAPPDDDYYYLFLVSGTFNNGYFNGDIHVWTKDTQIVIYGGDVWFLESYVPGDVCNLGEECQDDQGVIRAVPEPSSIALLGVALGGLWLGRRKRFS